MKIIYRKSKYMLAPYCCVLLGDSKDEIDEVCDWCEQQYGKSMTSNILTWWSKKWKYIENDPTSIGLRPNHPLLKNSGGLYFKKESDFVQFKLRWL